MQHKFVEGTSQHSLLRNRIKALYISKALVEKENIWDKYTNIELIEALKQISSIISKSEKGQSKFGIGAPTYNRFKKILDGMYISKALITEEIEKRK